MFLSKQLFSGERGDSNPPLMPYNCLDYKFTFSMYPELSALVLIQFVPF